ncbi:hypothetical protein [Pseudomonas sp. OA65]|uniref:hypothetical protein n=1 Tax=Pseudomonas sp. OA65 TaxID=2818431 RepID=UPI001A9EAC86|nr:hypothetical protein [Pseudomonas sp. OA65]MBO1538381.1 hypothetical protein [Pseudomonas sp. OA65]
MLTWRFASFCLTLALALPVMGMPAFALGVAVSDAMLLVTRLLLVPAPSGGTTTVSQD